MLIYTGYRVSSEGKRVDNKLPYVPLCFFFINAGSEEPTNGHMKRMVLVPAFIAVVYPYDHMND